MNPRVDRKCGHAQYVAIRSVAVTRRARAEAALRAMTIDAAWQCHSDHEVGNEVGKFADFVVLAEDPFAVEPERLAQIQVRETWVVVGRCTL